MSPQSPQSATVSLASEKDRYRTIFKSLDLIFEDISKKIYALDPKKDYILLKPNCIDTKKLAAVTHVDALQAVLDFLQPVWSGRIILAEGSGLGNTMEAFKNFNYLKLKNLFPNLEFLDLSYADATTLEAYDHFGKIFPLRVSKTVVNAPFRISVGPPKTHDSVVVTLSLKNMIVGSILKEDKTKIHQGPHAINNTLAHLAKFLLPDLAVIDGWVSMDGDGPVNGRPLETKFAVSSTNALAADVFVTERMGFNPIQVGYLNYLIAQNPIPAITVKGLQPAKFNFHFKKPATYLAQIQWSGGETAG